jgi:D-alanyl-D-alanine-carboxypeptidase/D-alanyl-D-alanine-endopeptidase
MLCYNRRLVVMRRIATWATVLCLLGTAPASSSAHDGNSLERRVAAVARPLIDNQQVVGLVVGLLEGRKSHVFGYGQVSSTSTRVPDRRTVFEIGSVTKVFTGLLLADLAQERLVRLDAPVQDLLPDSVQAPRVGQHEITLLDLATHTSALPRLPTNLAPRDLANPYADYTVEQLYEFLSNYSLPQTPGLLYHYSNVGVGLLGHVLARQQMTTYEALVVQRICEPLGMSETRITLADESRARRAQGHDASGKPVPNWDVPALSAAQGLHSTAEDLLTFLAANLGLVETRQWAAMQTTQAPRFTIDTSGNAIGMGWLIRPDGVLWHTGETGGYHSFVAIDELNRAGVVVLSNSAVSAVDEVGAAALQLLTGRRVNAR